MHESLTTMKRDTISRGDTQSNILEVLDGRSLLLILDDVWPDKLEWDPLHSFLKTCPRGSKVLVTSRNAKVARTMGAVRTLTLGYLTEEQCWDLFVTRAFVGGIYTADLEMIGREILRKCDFLPLAVKAMAGLLRGCTDIRKWNRILTNGVWKSEESSLRNENNAPNILPALKLSYDHLPPKLKQCFAYCCLFPKGFMFDKIELIKLWMGESYIQPCGEDTLEDTGSDYFDELHMRSFFQLLDIDNKKRYKMHDLIHDLANHVSSNCCQVKEHKQCSITTELRHVSFVCKDVQKSAQEILKAHKLRTLLLPTSYYRDFGQALDKLFRIATYLRVLDLNSSTILYLPQSIGELKLLRYLDLSRTEIRKLPGTICNLQKLQTLKLLQCPWLLELPQALGTLTELRYLELDEMFWHTCCTLPSRIGGLTNLHDFCSFHVRRKSGYEIRELKNMNNLEGILHISNLENSDGAAEAELYKKEKISIMTLEWSGDDAAAQDPTRQERVLEDLKPPIGLRELHIHHYKGTTISTWLRSGILQNLCKLSLNHCLNCRILSLGPLPQLRELCVKGMLELREWPETQYNSLTMLTISKCPKLRELPRIFPNLRVMKIKQCDELKALPVMPSLMFLRLIDNALLDDWHDVVTIAVSIDVGVEIHLQIISLRDLLELKVMNCPRIQEFPIVFSPQKLGISGCTSLRTLPNPQMSQRLQCLELDNCSGPSLLNAIPSTGSLYSLIISNITNLTSLPILPHLPGLKALYIHNCRDLTSMSSEPCSLQSLTSLKSFSICGCPELVTFLGERLPTSIEFLSIKKCSKLQSLHPRNCLTSLTSLKDLYLEDCTSLESLPEDGLPNSLQHLRIQGCPQLTQQCRQDTGGRYWQMIRHIADVELDPINTTEPRASAGHKKLCFSCFRDTSK